MKWIPDGRSVVEIVLLSAGWVVFGGLAAREFFEGRVPSQELFAIWAVITFALTAVNPLDILGDFFNRRGKGNGGDQ